MRSRWNSQHGSASVEQAGLVALIALLLLAAVAAVAGDGEIRAGRALAGVIAKRLACGPRLPGACRHHPLMPAYGWPLARLTRALAPTPAPRLGPSGLRLMPVDFRRCRRESCATAAGPHTTSANRRTTAFTELSDRRRDLGWVEIVYWLYRPGLGWERVIRRAGRAEVEAASHVPVLIKADPALVPLETLPGRNQYEFRAGEQPPWRWRVAGHYPGWSS